MHMVPAKTKYDRGTTEKVIPIWLFASLVPQEADSVFNLMTQFAI